MFTCNPCSRSSGELLYKSWVHYHLCALDMTKAFDKVNHYALFNKLMDRQVPREVLTTHITWYSLSAAFVRWGQYIFSI